MNTDTITIEIPAEYADTIAHVLWMEANVKTVPSGAVAKPGSKRTDLSYRWVEPVRRSLAELSFVISLKAQNHRDAKKAEKA